MVGGPAAFRTLGVDIGDFYSKMLVRAKGRIRERWQRRGFDHRVFPDDMQIRIETRGAPTPPSPSPPLLHTHHYYEVDMQEADLMLEGIFCGGSCPRGDVPLPPTPSRSEESSDVPCASQILRATRLVSSGGVGG